MNEYVAQTIKARKDAIFNAYELNADGKKKVDFLFEKIKKFGTKFKDVGEFEAEFAKSPLNQQYLDLFTEIATSMSAKGAASAAKPSIGGIVAGGIVGGVADRVATEAKNAVLPTRAAVHQKAYDAARDVPVLGNAIDIGQKASYAAHLGKLFSKKTKTKNKNGEGRPDVVARLCMVVDWCIDHSEYTAKIKVIPKKDYPILMPCEF